MPPEDPEPLLARLRELENRLEEAEDTLRAIGSGEVDAVVVAAPDGDRIYTLKGADEAYRLLVEQMAEGAVTLSTDGLILFSNDQFAALLGLPLERVIGSRIPEFVTPEDAGVLAALLAARDGAKAEARFQRAGGPPVPVYLSANILRQDGVECVSLIVTDLTEQKRNEEIVASERLARSILEQAAGATLVVDLAGRIIRANRAAADLAGAAVLLRAFDGAFPLRAGAEAKAYPFEEMLATLRQTGNIAGLQATADIPHGRALDLLVNAALLAGPDCAPLGCVLVLTDITALKRTEGALRISAARERRRAAELQAIMEAVPVAVFVSHDRECRHMTSNRAACEMLGAPAGSNASMSTPDGKRPANFRVLKDGQEIPPAELPVQVAARTGRPVGDCEWDVVLDDGTSRRWLGKAVPLLDDAGQPHGAIGAFIDITDRRMIEERLREAAKHESVGLLAGGVAHDFNNLLVGVIGNASLAQEMLPPKSDASDLLDGIIRTGEQAAHLTRQLLAYSGKGHFVIEALDLSALVPEICVLVLPSLSKKIAIDMQLDPNLPPVDADRGQIHQVFTNLALNAGEAIGGDAGQITVRTGVRNLDAETIRRDPAFADLPPGPYVYLEVRDTGCGMDEDTRAKVFDPFFTTKFLGRGLGLAAVRGIVRAHKGVITVASEPGKGSCFTLLLPRSRTASAILEDGARPRSELPGRARTILVVDDEPSVRNMVKQGLERRGFRVLLAESGLAAIDALKREPGEISLVLLDLSMPGMSGGEALPELRRIRPGVKVVASSGYSETETLKFFQGSPVSGFIQKPYTIGRLLETVERAIGA